MKPETGSRWSRLAATVALVSVLAACSSPWRDSYFNKGLHRLTQEEVRDKFGPPHTAKTPALGGDTVWTYRFPLSDKDLDPWNPTFIADASQTVSTLMSKGQEGPKPTLYCYRYTLTFDEAKTLKSWKREECVPGTRHTLTAK